MLYKNSEKDWINLVVFSSFYVSPINKNKYDICGTVNKIQDGSHLEYDFKTEEEAQKFLDALMYELSTNNGRCSYDEILDVLENERRLLQRETMDKP
jgi:hypothetical protein